MTMIRASVFYSQIGRSLVQSGMTGHDIDIRFIIRCSSWKKMIEPYIRRQVDFCWWKLLLRNIWRPKKKDSMLSSVNEERTPLYALTISEKTTVARYFDDFIKNFGSEAMSGRWIFDSPLNIYRSGAKCNVNVCGVGQQLAVPGTDHDYNHRALSVSCYSL